ncbi:MAG: group III truncated hemoglobin [Flavipsychrobacter sp.]
MSKLDIQNREDIELLVNTFYDDVKQDDTIGYIFQETIGDDWSHHMPIMYQFWESVLLGKATYSGNPIQKHIKLDQNIPLKEEHYGQWLNLWTSTVDKLYEGEIADLAKNRASNMVHLIKMKVEMARSGKSIL